MIEVINLEQKLGLFHETWQPRIVGELNDFHVKVVKVQGEFIWHSHVTEDEMFLVLHGCLAIRLRDRDLTIHEGEFVIIPHGVEHMPVAEEEAHLLLLEPKGTVNTGTENSERTVEALWI